MAKAVAVYKGGIHGLRELAVRATDGHCFIRYQERDPRFGYKWTAWTSANYNLDLNNLPTKIERGFATLFRNSPFDPAPRVRLPN